MQRHRERPQRTHWTQTAPSPCLGDGLTCLVGLRAAAPSEKTSLRIALSSRRVTTTAIGLNRGHVHLSSLADAHAWGRRRAPSVESLEVPDHDAVGAIEQREQALGEPL